MMAARLARLVRAHRLAARGWGVRLRGAAVLGDCTALRAAAWALWLAQRFLAAALSARARTGLLSRRRGAWLAGVRAGAVRAAFPGPASDFGAGDNSGGRGRSPFGLPAVLALYTAAALALWVRVALPFWPRHKSLVLLGAVACLWAAEWARGHWFSGFPWNLFGLAYAEYLPLAQAAALAGVYGLSALALLFGLLPLALWRAPPLGAASALLLGALAAWGQWRLAQPEPPAYAAAPPLQLKLVQPDFVQATKWDAAELPAQLETLLQLSAPVTPGMIVIWPEAALGTFLAENAAVRQRIAALLPPGSWLISGSVRRAVHSDGTLQFFNAVLVLDDEGRVREIYDKHHLVPFGEYIPLLEARPALAQRVRELGLEGLASLGLGFSRGAGPQRLALAALRWPQPLICYEAIFPNRLASPRPHWLLNLTNDAWFGEGMGPEQHLAAARLRALETGCLCAGRHQAFGRWFDALGRERGPIAWAPRRASCAAQHRGKMNFMQSHNTL